MTLQRLTSAEASALSVRTLGLDDSLVDLGSPEGLAASLRRAASVMCPTSPGRLVDAVNDAVRPLATPPPDRQELMEFLDHLIAGGDLLERRQDLHGRSVRLLFLGPPSYIERTPGTYLLMGVRPYGAPLVEGDLALQLSYEAHTRTLQLDIDTARETLAALDLREMAKDRWTASPRVEPPDDLIGRVQARLDVGPNPGDLEDVRILDPTKSVLYYSGRWRAPAAGDTGDFLARRPQAYGADLWCVMRLASGVPQRLIELPIDDPVMPGRDEAWRWQAAVDARAGTPQQYLIRVDPMHPEERRLDFFSPLPGFAERYLQLIGLALGRTQGALYSFRVPNASLGDASTLLTDLLWMEPKEGRS